MRLTTKLTNTNQTGAAMLVGVAIMALLILGAVIIGYLSLTQEEGPSLRLNAPEITADDLLNPGDSNNELTLDSQIVEAGLKRDEEQRKAAEDALNDEAQPVGDGVTISTTVEAARLSQLQTEFISEVDRRLKALGELEPVIEKLPSEQKTAVRKLINDETTALTGLKAKAAAETSKDAFLDDRADLEKEYVNYGLALAQARMLRWINDQSVLIGKVNVLGGKFQERINRASSSGSSTAAAQTVLNGYQTNKNTATDLNAEMLKAVMAVKPGKYEANRAVLKTYYNQLAGGHIELTKAVNAAKDLTSKIKGFKE